MTREEQERLRKLIADHEEDPGEQKTEEGTGIDYAEEYKKQTGKDLVTDDYTVQ